MSEVTECVTKECCELTGDKYLANLRAGLQYHKAQVMGFEMAIKSYERGYQDGKEAQDDDSGRTD